MVHFSSATRPPTYPKGEYRGTICRYPSVYRAGQTEQRNPQPCCFLVIGRGSARMDLVDSRRHSGFDGSFGRPARPLLVIVEGSQKWLGRDFPGEPKSLTGR